MFSSLYRRGLQLVDVCRILASILSIPGTVLHETAHACGCVLTGTEIIEIQFWQWQNYLDWEATEQPSGTVWHASPEKPWHGVVISSAPVALCFSCGVLVFGIADLLAFPSSLVPVYLASVFVFHMQLSGSDVRNIERHTADLSGLEAVIRDAFVRLSRSHWLPLVCIATGVVLLFDLPLWLVGPVLASQLLVAGLFALYDWVADSSRVAQ
ncbi:hypothetical protein NDI56_16265 [Haloarcula sp. S1CR25-12]|uniref:DUF3267 domain-containing protein n=1 Tax=Haloarcula saliterrae TaxID=2950534 RepID=A0ABU2FFB9_9EURY|nr:hypothetical protein [Haloarcula sp. S1CR25-12]MDS0260957.1 hypothetical protein [Haloarcula sp. S1CR25-12]